MKIFKSILVLSLSLLICAPNVLALKGKLATSEDVLMLKRDLLGGKINIGKTRLMNIQDEYGEPPNIIDDDKRITYDYGDLRLTFDRARYWRDWEKDSFRDPVYTDSVNDLRFDLESKELVGQNLTLDMIRRSYGEPTESYETSSDGEKSVYYYGDIKLTFENVIAVKSWRGANLGEQSQASGGLTEVYQSIPSPAETQVKEVASEE